MPQQAWIQNRSLKDCVIFNNPLDEKRYRKIVRACALKPDIEMFPAGDATEIGEKVTTVIVDCLLYTHTHTHTH